MTCDEWDGWEIVNFEPTDMIPQLIVMSQKISTGNVVISTVMKLVLNNLNSFEGVQ